MLNTDRLSTIKQILLNDKKIVVTDLSQQFSVTEETIRRDLDKLERDGFITRTYGGAVLNSTETVANIPFYKRATHHIEAKKQMALLLQDVIHDQRTLFADSSSTVMEAIKLLKNRDELTIVTNSAEMTKELYISNVQVISTGGMLNKRSLAFEGDLAETAIQRYNTDIALISCKGLDMGTGVTDTNEGQARLKRMMIDQAHQVILLADSSKFDKKAFIHLADFDHINHIITESRPSDEWLAFFNQHGIQVHFS